MGKLHAMNEQAFTSRWNEWILNYAFPTSRQALEWQTAESMERRRINHHGVHFPPEPPQNTNTLEGHWKTRSMGEKQNREKVQSNITVSINHFSFWKYFAVSQWLQNKHYTWRISSATRLKQCIWPILNNHFIRITNTPAHSCYDKHNVAPSNSM